MKVTIIFAIYTINNERKKNKRKEWHKSTVLFFFSSTCLKDNTNLKTKIDG